VVQVEQAVLCMYLCSVFVDSNFCHPSCVKELLFNFSSVKSHIVLVAVVLHCDGSKVMFALQIGSVRQLATCNVQLDDDLTDGQVLLQYTRNQVSPSTTLGFHLGHVYLLLIVSVSGN